MPTTKLATTYRCGTLTYTLPRLFFVLFWVVVGSAVIAVGTQLPSIMLPVQLKELGVSETAKVFLLSAALCVLALPMARRWRKRSALIAPTILALVADAIWLAVRVRLARMEYGIPQPQEETRPTAG